MLKEGGRVKVDGYTVATDCNLAFRLAKRWLDTSKTEQEIPSNHKQRIKNESRRRSLIEEKETCYVRKKN